MDIGQILAVREQWYDRSLGSDIFVWNPAVGPHVATDRITETVPAGTIYILQTLSIARVVDTAPTTPGMTVGTLKYWPNGGSNSNVIESHLYITAADEELTAHYNFGLFMLPGDVITFSSLDESVGSSVDWTVSILINKFAQ